MSSFGQSLQTLAALTRKDKLSGVNHSFVDNSLRIFQQSKELSQIVAFIWLWADKDDNGDEERIQKIKAAKFLKVAFEHPYDQGNTDMNPLQSRLWRLLTAVPKKDGSDEEQALFWVFPNHVELCLHDEYIFPIFERADERYYTVTVNTDKFHGVITDPTTNTNYSKCGWILPYPPRPQLGELTVTEIELNAWVENNSPEKYFSENPYIPSTCV
jgi:hypothetical protein